MAIGRGRAVYARVRRAQTGMSADEIRELAHAFANAERAMLCWTLGITEHHNAVDNVFALINLALLTGHVGRTAAGSTRCAARTTSRAAATWARCPIGCRASSTSRTTRAGEVRAGVGRDDPATARPAPHGDVRRDGERRLRAAVRHRREPGPVGGRPGPHARLLEGLDFLVVQDIFLTGTAEMADVVLPAAAAWAESRGHGHQHRAARPTRAQSARSARRGPR